MLGTSLDVVASLMNHSCNPTAFVVFEGSSLCVRSIRKIPAGKEVTQCYTDVDKGYCRNRIGSPCVNTASNNRITSTTPAAATVSRSVRKNAV